MKYRNWKYCINVDDKLFRCIPYDCNFLIIMISIFHALNKQQEHYSQNVELSASDDA